MRYFIEIIMIQKTANNLKTSLRKRYCIISCIIQKRNESNNIVHLPDHFESVTDSDRVTIIQKYLRWITIYTFS